MKMRTALLRPLLTTVLSGVLLSGCGFHLRDTAAVPSALQPLYIGGPVAGGALGQAMRVQLSSVDTAVSPTIMGARYELRLLGEGYDQRDASVDRRGLVAEYLLITSAEFALYDQAGALVLGPVRVDERRSIFNDPDKATTTSEEIRLVRADMEKVLAQRIALRLTAYANQLKKGAAAGAAATPAATATP